MPIISIKPRKPNNTNAIWFSGDAPRLRRPTNVKQLPQKLVPGYGQTAPSTIPSTDLPSRIRSIISSHLHRRATYIAKPHLDPLYSQHGQFKPRLVPEHTPVVDAQGIEHIDIPNPFVVYRYPREDFHPKIRRKVVRESRRLIPHRVQKMLLARHPPWCLPPSPINPLEEVPSIEWKSAEKGTKQILHWVGDWAPKVRKGIYANRGVIFKGRRREREREEKAEDLAERLAGMDERISKWRAQKLQAKIAARPQIPF